MSQSVNATIAIFRHFLVASWPSIVDVLNNIDWDEDVYYLDYWLQANWELIVERLLLNRGEQLYPYGFDRSSDCRYGKSIARPTHRVVCRKHTDSKDEFDFLCFVSKNGNSIKIEPPFDLAYVEHKATKNRTCLSVAEIDFDVVNSVNSTLKCDN